MKIETRPVAWSVSIVAALTVTALTVAALLAAPPSFAAHSEEKRSDGDDFKQRLAVGYRLHDSGQYDAAIALYRDMLEDYPKHPLLLYEMAYSSLANHKPKDALEYAGRALKQNSSHDGACYQVIGTAYDDLGDYAKGEKAFRQGLQKDPHAALLHYNLGVNLIKQKRTADAIDELRAALRDNPKHPGSWNGLGVAYSTAGQRSRAFVAFARFLTLEPDTRRSPPAAKELWRLLFQGVTATPKEGSGADVNIEIPSPSDKEDDPAAAEGMVISLVAASRHLDEWKQKNDAQFFAHAFGEVLTILSELDDSATTKDPFWTDAALSYFQTARGAGYLEAMAYSVRQSLKEPEVLEWLAAHEDAVARYRAWSDAWKPVAPAPEE